jgi:hypothetical protein
LGTALQGRDSRPTPARDAFLMSCHKEGNNLETREKFSSAFCKKEKKFDESQRNAPSFFETLG